MTELGTCSFQTLISIAGQPCLPRVGKNKLTAEYHNLKFTNKML
jgi:hypothetical protein